ncbi:helix-turn-helix domain-containing protein [Paraburkholderia sp. BR10936]|uniref:helix-turn-helix domain-containing protein n=1 Tax=Paraburkholderia sp. BR10936 TaxID=3236993 RepID=UPI0034D1D463
MAAIRNFSINPVAHNVSAQYDDESTARQDFDNLKMFCVKHGEAAPSFSKSNIPQIREDEDMVTGEKRTVTIGDPKIVYVVSATISNDALEKFNEEINSHAVTGKGGQSKKEAEKAKYFKMLNSGKKMTQKEFADYLGVSTTTIYNWNQERANA